MSELVLNIYDGTEDRLSKITVESVIKTGSEIFVRGPIKNGLDLMKEEESDEVVYGVLQDKSDEKLFYAYEKVINIDLWDRSGFDYEIKEVTDKARFFFSFNDVINLVFKEEDFIGLPGEPEELDDPEEINRFVSGLIESGDIEEGGDEDVSIVSVTSFKDIGDRVEKADL